MIDTPKSAADAQAEKAKIVADIPVLDKAAKEGADKGKKKAAAAGPKAIKAKTVKRRLARIADESNPKKARKKRDKLAGAIVAQIAAGTIKAPRAVAKAFVTGAAKQVEKAPKVEKKAK